MKKKYKIYYEYKTGIKMDCYLGNFIRNFDSREEAENYLMNPENIDHFDKKTNYFVLPIYTKE